MASLDAGMLGRRSALRRVPLSFAPAEPDAPGPDPVLDDVNEEAVAVPEIRRQLERLALAMELPAAAAQQVDASAAGARRIAFTLRLDPERHGHLRQIAAAQRRSAQRVLADAFDHYCAGCSPTSNSYATQPSPSYCPTGNQS
jgi:hypothetical protein